ncbi:MAG: hypothetical protein JWQ35_1302, partial [Bacteriovoracaceae bacterium]|nr:hypothetical protein [Bacteriovoracaceae bacterium]
GPVNTVSPNPATNLEFSKTLARVLHRSLGPRVPKFALKLLLGEIAEELFASTRAIPKKLIQSNFKFTYPELEAALESVLSKERS